MAINMFQRLRLTFDFSVNVAYFVSHQYIKTKFSQKPLGQLNSNFIWRVEGSKCILNVNGHMTKMAAMPIFKYLVLWNQKANGFGTWNVALRMWTLPDLHKSSLQCQGRRRRSGPSPRI